MRFRAIRSVSISALGLGGGSGSATRSDSPGQPHRVPRTAARPLVATSFLSLVAAGLAGVSLPQPAAGAEVAAAEVAAAGPDSVRVPEQAELATQELPGRANRYSATMRRPDGRYEVAASPGPVHFRDEDGSWKPIQRKLVASDAVGAAVENLANAYEIQIPQNAANAPVQFIDDGAWVKSKLRGLRGAPDVAGAEAVFEDLEPSVVADAVRLRDTGSGLKEEIQLDQAPAAGEAPEYVYDLTVSPGVTPRLTSDGFVDFRRDGVSGAKASVFVIPPGVMVDSASSEPGESDAVAYALEPGPGAGRWVLTVTPDAEWLAAPERVYPVLVDPSFNAGYPTQDCTLINGSQADTQHCGNNTLYLRAGKLNGTKYRGLVEFDVSSIPSTADVTAASLELRVEASQSTGSGSPTFGAFRAGRMWASGATWNDSNQSGAWTGGDPQVGGHGVQAINGSLNNVISFDGTGMADLVQGWVAQTLTNTGLVVKSLDESVAKRISFVSSSTNNVYWKRPRLRGTYNDAPSPSEAFSGERRFWEYTKRELTDRITAKVNNGTGNLLLSARDAMVSGVAGQDMNLTRSYNSMSHDQGDARMGLGWSHEFGGSVRLEFPDSETVFFYGPSGYRAQFNKEQDGSYIRSTDGPGIKADFSFDANAGANGEYTLKWYDKSKYVFDDQGYLQRAVDKNDNKLTFTYANLVANSAPVLATVTDTRGRTAQFDYTNGLITTVEIKNGGSGADTLLRYEYRYGQTPSGAAVLTSSQLAEVGTTLSTAQSGDLNVGAETTYEYDDAGRMTKMTDARENTTNDGGITEFTYSADRVAKLIRRTPDGGSIPDSIVDFTYYDEIAAGPDAVCKTENGELVDENANTRTLIDGERAPSDAADVTQHCVDNLGRILRTVDANGRQRSKGYDAQSNVEHGRSDRHRRRHRHVPDDL